MFCTGVVPECADFPFDLAGFLLQIRRHQLTSRMTMSFVCRDPGSSVRARAEFRFRQSLGDEELQFGAAESVRVRPHGSRAQSAGLRVGRLLRQRGVRQRLQPHVRRRPRESARGQVQPGAHEPAQQRGRTEGKCTHAQVFPHSSCMQKTRKLVVKMLTRKRRKHVEFRL